MAKIFQKELYFKERGTQSYDSGVSKHWVDACDGRECGIDVGIDSDSYKCIGTDGLIYIISSRWVKEVK